MYHPPRTCSPQMQLTYSFDRSSKDAGGVVWPQAEHSWSCSGGPTTRRTPLVRRRALSPPTDRPTGRPLASSEFEAGRARPAFLPALPASHSAASALWRRQPDRTPSRDDVAIRDENSPRPLLLPIIIIIIITKFGMPHNGSRAAGSPGFSLVLRDAPSFRSIPKEGRAAGPSRPARHRGCEPADAHHPF